MSGKNGSDMTEEIFDIVDENGQPAGGTVTRSQAHADGIRHRTAHIWGFEKMDARISGLLAAKR